MTATLSLFGLLPHTQTQLTATGEKQYAESWAQRNGLPSSPGFHCSSLVPQQQSDAFEQMSLILYPFFQLFLVGAPICSELLHYSHN